MARRESQPESQPESQQWVPNVTPAVAAERLLDAAGRCFARDGVVSTTMSDVADEAGCSRPTVYRYFADRTALRQAFVDRESRRVGERALEMAGGISDPQEQVVEAMMASLEGVRSDQTLAAWFRPGGVATAAGLAASSDVIESLAFTMFGGDEGGLAQEARLRAKWLVRVIISFLSHPGESPDEERALLTRFVAPAVLAEPVPTAAG